MATPISPAKAGYRTRLDNRQRDEDTGRNRHWNALVGIVSTLVLLFGPAFLFSFWGALLGGYQFSGWILGFCLGTFWLAPTLVPSRMIISNPENTGYATLNMRTGEQEPYAEGFHWSKWWEQRNATGNLSLKVITDSFDVEVSTKTSKVDFEVTFGFRRSRKYLITSITADPATIEKNLRGFMDSFLTAHAAREEAAKVLTMSDELNIELADEFVETETEERPATDLEELTGFEIVSLLITGIKLSEAVQKVRDSADRNDQMMEIVARMRGISVAELEEKRKSGDISSKEFQSLYTLALANSQTGGTNIHLIEGQAGNFMVTGGGSHGRS